MTCSKRLWLGRGLILRYGGDISGGSGGGDTQTSFGEVLEKRSRRRDHMVVARQLSCDEMDEIARTHLQPVLDKYEVMKRR